MGTWGYKPYENDAAGDWFGDLWDELPLPAKVEETLELDVEDYHEEIRAAAHLLIQLGEVYIWPVDLLDHHCDLAARQFMALVNADLPNTYHLGVCLSDDEIEASARNAVKTFLRAFGKRASA